MLHARFSAGGGEDIGVFFLLFFITHTQEKCIGSLCDFRGENHFSLGFEQAAVGFDSCF